MAMPASHSTMPSSETMPSSAFMDTNTVSGHIEDVLNNQGKLHVAFDNQAFEEAKQNGCVPPVYPAWPPKSMQVWAHPGSDSIQNENIQAPDEASLPHWEDKNNSETLFGSPYQQIPVSTPYALPLQDVYSNGPSPYQTTVVEPFSNPAPAVPPPAPAPAAPVVQKAKNPSRATIWTKMKVAYLGFWNDLFNWNQTAQAYPNQGVLYSAFVNEGRSTYLVAIVAIFCILPFLLWKFLKYCVVHPRHFILVQVLAVLIIASVVVFYSMSPTIDSSQKFLSILTCDLLIYLLVLNIHLKK